MFGLQRAENARQPFVDRAAQMLLSAHARNQHGCFVVTKNEYDRTIDASRAERQSCGGYSPTRASGLSSISSQTAKPRCKFLSRAL